MSVFICVICGLQWPKLTSLKSHQSRNAECKQLAKEREKAVLQDLNITHQNKISERYVEVTDIEDNDPPQQNAKQQDDLYHDLYNFDTAPNEESNDYSDVIATFNTSKEVLLGFKSCQKGVGLSIADMDRLLKIMLHEGFNPKDLAFTNGVQANRLVKDLISESNADEVSIIMFHL